MEFVGINNTSFGNIDLSIKFRSLTLFKLLDEERNCFFFFHLPLGHFFTSIYIVLIREHITVMAAAADASTPVIKDLFIIVNCFIPIDGRHCQIDENRIFILDNLL